MAYYGNQPIAGETNSFKVLDDISSYTKTFDGSSAAVVSTSDDTLTFYDHRFIQGQRVTYGKGSGGTVITGLTDDTVYYVIRQDKDTIQLATSASNAATLTAIDLTGVGGGTVHELTVAFDGTNTKFKATTGGGTHIKLTRPGQLMISMNGVVQEPQNNTPTNGFGIESNNVIVFSTAPTVLDTFWGHYLTTNLSSWEMSDNKIDNFTGNGSTTTYTLSKTPANADNILVTIDGVTQYPSDSANTRAYSLNASVVTFTSAPALNAAIAVRHIGYAGGSGGGSGGGGVTGFYGRTGNVSVIRSDLQNTDINLKNLTGVAATFTGNVSIGGTLTYMDVTNVDAVGIITAQAGIDLGIGATAGKFEAATGITTFSTSVGIADSIHHVGNTDTSIRFPADDTFAVETAGSEALRIKSDGSVGIGSVIPRTGFKLDVNGDLSLGESGGTDNTYIDQQQNGDLHIINSGRTANGSAVNITGGAGGIGINRYNTIAGDTTYHRDFTVYNGKSTKVLMVDGSSSQVGIGTDNPARKVEIFDTAATVLQLNSTNTGGTSLRIQNSGTDKMYMGLAGDFIVGQGSNVTDSAIRASGALLFASGGGNERLRFDSDGKLFLHGADATGSNNTSTLLPNGYTLNIHGTSSNDGISVVRYNASYGAYGLNIGKSNNSTFGTNTLVTDGEELGHVSFYGADGTDFNMAAQITGEVDGDPSDGTDMPGALVFKTSAEESATPTERLRITSGGQVNIGSNLTQTTYVCEVAGAYNKDGMRIVSGAPNYQDPLVVASSTGGERFRIKGDGNVGIARTDPNQRLNVNGNIETNAHDNSGGNGGYYTAKGLIIGNAYDAGKTGLNDDRNAIIWQERGLDLDFATNDTFRMKIDYNGNVAIGGTSNVGTLLHIENGSGDAYIRCRASINKAILFNNSDGTAHGFLGSGGTNGGTAADLAIQSNSGNVKIHTASAIINTSTGNDGLVLEPTVSASTSIILNTWEDDSACRNWAIRNRYSAHGRLEFMRGTNNTNEPLTTIAYFQGSTFHVSGTFSKNGGSFKIPHPVVGLSTTKDLVHSFIEGPQMDLIYRGKVTLSSGAATVNLDTVSNMTEGTFVALNRDVQCFTTNETGWGAVKGSVSGNILTISAQDGSSTDTISWMVIGERQDDTVKSLDMTDDNGNLIVEPLRESVINN